MTYHTFQISNSLKTVLRDRATFTSKLHLLSNKQKSLEMLRSFILSSVILTLLSVSSACEKKSNVKDGPGTCEHSKEIEKSYLEDARQLLFREIYRDSSAHPDFTNPRFDPAKLDEILNAIQAVYDLRVPQRDSVFLKHKIHTFPRLGLQSISIKVDTSSIEVQKLVNKQPTGNALLDSIVTAFKFNEVQTSYSYPDFNWLTIISDEQLNLFPIIKELRTLPFFHIVEFGGGAVGDGNDITMERSQGVIKLDFSIGWGDCPAGCIYRKHWVFEVDKNCNASFIKSLVD